MGERLPEERLPETAFLAGTEEASDGSDNGGAAFVGAVGWGMDAEGWAKEGGEGRAWGGGDGGLWGDFEASGGGGVGGRALWGGGGGI